MTQTTICLLPGDHAGIEVTASVEQAIEAINLQRSEPFQTLKLPIGGESIDAFGSPLTDSVLEKIKACQAIFLGAVGGPKWESIPRDIRPEKGLLKLRSKLDLFANIRPSKLSPALENLSPLKPERVAGLDVTIVRELTGGLYFGEPRGIDHSTSQRRGFNTMTYTEQEITRTAKVAFEIAMKRNKKLCSVDKANVLETSELWREVVTSLSSQYPQVELSHMYVDNAAMQLATYPKQFDVILTENLFGDILSDLASVLPGSIGMLPSASLGDGSQPYLYEPCHGSAPDIAGQNKVNPCAALLSLAMMMRYSFSEAKLAFDIEQAIDQAIGEGFRTPDLGGTNSTQEVTQAIISNLT